MPENLKDWESESLIEFCNLNVKVLDDEFVLGQQQGDPPHELQLLLDNVIIL